MRAGVLLVLSMIAAFGSASCTPQQYRADAPDALDTPLRGETGVEVQVWTVTLDPQFMLNALAEAQSGDEAIANAEAWRANALRVFRVDRGRLPELRAAMQRTGSVERSWIAPDGGWQRLVDSGSSRERLILLDSGPLPLAGERPELLVRCWVEPLIADGGVGGRMRVEFLPRIADAGRAPVGFRVDRPGEDGLPLERLSASLAALSGEAFIIAPFDPDLRVRTEEEDRAGEADQPVGPPAPPRPPHLGETVLRTGISPRGSYPQRPAARVVVLIPSIPEHYSLLGRRAER